MNVHDQLIDARHEESPSAARAGSVPGWCARALRFWARRLRRPAAAGPAIDPMAPSQVQDDCAARLVIPWEQQRWRLRRHLHNGLRFVLTGLTLGLGTALALLAGQTDLQLLPRTLKAETQRAITDLRRITSRHGPGRPARGRSRWA